MKKITFVKMLGIFLLLLPFFYSCQDHVETFTNDSISKAQKIVETNPTEASRILATISDPKNLSSDDYMLYVLTSVQAKFKLKQDIKNDTLIYRIPQYFEQRNNSNLLILAHYYAACVYNANDITEKGLEHYFLSNSYARKEGNILFEAKSLHALGNIYYVKKDMETAIYYYKNSKEAYQKVDSDVSKNIMSIMRFIGLAYIDKKDYKNAFDYFNQGLTLAKENQSQSFISEFEHYIGIVYREKGEYEKAAEFFLAALSNNSDETRLPNIYLSFLILYNKTGELVSAKQYVSMLEQSLPQITYQYTLQESYEALAEYYHKTGNYEKALLYTNSLKDINLKISERNSSKKFNEAERLHKAALHEKELASAELKNYMLFIIGIAIISILILVGYFRNRHLQMAKQKEMEKNRLLEERNRLLAEKNESLEKEMKTKQELLEQQEADKKYMESIYHGIITDWAEIDKMVKKMAKDYGVTEVPEVFVKIQNMVDGFKQNTNNRLVHAGKKYLISQPHGTDSINDFKERDLLLFSLYRMGYKRKEVALLMGVHPQKDNMMYRKYDLRNKLLKTGMPEKEVETVLSFSEDD